MQNLILYLLNKRFIITINTNIQQQIFDNIIILPR
jgi:hypothetical protein